MWSSLFGGSTAQNPNEPTTDAGQQISSFFTGIGTNVNSFFAGVANPDSVQDSSDAAADVGKQIGNFFSGVGTQITETWAKTTITTPAEDREQFAYVKHFGEYPPTCLQPEPTKYTEQKLKDELFDDEWSEFLKFKESPICEGFSDRFLMACLFARKLDIKRTEEMLTKNKAWREENGYFDIPSFDSLNKKMLEDGKFALKVPGCRGKNGEGIIYVKMGNMVPADHEDFTENCVKWTVWNGMHGGLDFEGMDYFRNGIMMVADLTGMGWHNVDLSVQQRIGSALLDNFPMRTCKILIINPPWILNAFLGGMALFIKKKVMDRIYVLEGPHQLLDHIPAESLLSEYGGTLEYSIPHWFKFIEEQEARLTQKKSDSSSSSV